MFNSKLTVHPAERTLHPHYPRLSRHLTGAEKGGRRLHPLQSFKKHGYITERRAEIRVVPRSVKRVKNAVEKLNRRSMPESSIDSPPLANRGPRRRYYCRFVDSQLGEALLQAE